MLPSSNKIRQKPRHDSSQQRQRTTPPAPPRQKQANTNSVVRRAPSPRQPLRTKRRGQRGRQHPKRGQRRRQRRGAKHRRLALAKPRRRPKLRPRHPSHHRPPHPRPQRRLHRPPHPRSLRRGPLHRRLQPRRGHPTAPSLRRESTSSRRRTTPSSPCPASRGGKRWIRLLANDKRVRVYVQNRPARRDSRGQGWCLPLGSAGVYVRIEGLRWNYALCLFRLPSTAPPVIRVRLRDQDDCPPGEFCFQAKCSKQRCTPGEQRPCYDGDPRKVGTGPCREGVQICLKDGSQWSPCQGQILPRPEICDRLDNDCDGSIDEEAETGGCICEPGGKQECYNGPVGTQKVGDCQAGVQYCEMDRRWGRCYGQNKPASREVCDQRDNDCNGLVDEGCSCQKGESQPCYTGPKDQPGRGICRKGSQECVNGQWGKCQGDVTPQKERCDGKDNDCDGEIDEEYEEKGKPCTTANGSTGTYHCLQGRLHCQPLPHESTPDKEPSTKKEPPPEKEIPLPVETPPDDGGTPHEPAPPDEPAPTESPSPDDGGIPHEPRPPDEPTTPDEPPPPEEEPPPEEKAPDDGGAPDEPWPPEAEPPDEYYNPDEPWSYEPEPYDEYYNPDEPWAPEAQSPGG